MLPRTLFDRHRGGGHPPTPATPPCVRVGYDEECGAYVCCNCGAHFPYVCKEGEITLARLSRENNRYRMFLARGEFIAQPRAKLAQTCPSWPHGFVKTDIEPEEFISRFNTNHAHLVPGVHTESLKIYCDLMEIPVDKVS